MIEHHGNFHGVGQGLFASGHITANSQHLHYVYDCGGETSKRILKKRVDEELRSLQGRRLDILFLSHFHRDHTSGLDLLLKGLKGQGGVNTVVLPYLYPAERAVLAGYMAEEEGYPRDPDGWYTQFLNAPAKYLKENGAKNIYFVRGGDGPETLPLEKLIPHEPSGEPQEQGEANEPEATSISFKMQVFNSTFADGVKEAETSSSLDGDDVSLFSLVSARSTLVSPWWFFILFNKDIPESKVKQFQDDFDDIRGDLSLKEVLSDKGICREAKIAYERIFGRSRLNDTSLAVLSSPSCFPERNHFRIRFYNAPPEPFLFYRQEEVCCFDGCSPHRLGFVFLGDLRANKEWAILSRKFGFTRDNLGTVVLTYQVAHHGSDNNWSSNQLELISRPTYVICAGTKNRHDHPDAAVLRDIAMSNSPLRWVNEHCSFPHCLHIFN